MHNVNGEGYEVFSPEQAPDAFMPNSAGWTDPGTGQTYKNVVGSPKPGLTNAESAARFGVAYAGRADPGTTTKPGVRRFACDLSGDG